MTRDEALAKLRPREAELRARGIEALYLFGSVARGEAKATSDIDLLFEVQPTHYFSLLDQCQIQVDLTDRLAVPVDFVDRESLRPRMRGNVEPDIVKVF